MVNVRRKLTFFYTVVCISNLIAFSAGICIGWNSPVTAKLTNKNKIVENPLGATVTSEEESWISSVVGLGTVVGPILAGFMSTKLGRKKTLIFCSGIPLLISYLMLAFGKNVIVYYIARFIGGITIGTVMSVLPNFLSEISEDTVRGTMSSSLNVFLLFGMLYAYTLGPYLSIMWFNLACAVWPALFIVLFYLFVPESPYYFIAFNNTSSAIKSLKKFRSVSESNIMIEMKTIASSVQQDKENVASFSNMFKSKASVKAFIITIGLLSFQQLSGIIVVLFNTQEIFSATGSDIPPEISTIIIGAVQFSASFVTPLAVDKLGRKFLLLISAIGMFIAEVSLGLFFYMKNNVSDVSGISWLPILCLVVYIISYNFGFGILPWTIMAEVFPANIKAPASTLSACFAGALSFVLTLSYASLNAAIGIGGTFWLFSAFCAMAMPFITWCVIETKGRSFQEIQIILSK